MQCDECRHPVTVHNHSGCVSCQARHGDAFWCSRTEDDIAAMREQENDDGWGTR